MSIATQTMNKPLILEAHEPLAARMACSVVALSADDLPDDVTAKVKVCLMDLIGCAFESRALPWSRQAHSIAERAGDPAAGASIIGSPDTFTFGDAAFVNAVMGHGLVREDMHSGSISHLGIAVLPALLALAQYRRSTGRDFIAATVAGYEVGGQVGRAAMDAEVAAVHRPTGISGPIAAGCGGGGPLGGEFEENNNADGPGGENPPRLNQIAPNPRAGK